jgi:hypothetical protein
MLGSRTLVVLTALALCLTLTAAFAEDIVTVPTANQLCAGQFDVAAYHIELDLDGPEGAVGAQTLYAGLSNSLELDVHRYDVNLPGTDFDAVTTIFNATYLVVREDATKPNVVIGGRDLSGELGHASWFVCSAKTLNPPAGPPTGPIYRLHLSLGTEDNTLLGEPRHEGLFGGVQICVKPVFPQVGVVGLYDGQDVITGVTFTPTESSPTFKGGTFGDHWWVGISYRWMAIK